MIGFDECRKMGEHATSGTMSNYKNTITGMKRLVGLAFDDPRAQREMKELPNQFVPIEHSYGPAKIGVNVKFAGTTTVVPIEAVMGMMIKHMGEIAAQKAQATDSSLPLENFMPQDWCIAIPNYYTDSQRRAVLTACNIVGINGVQRLMHENTATALAYGIFKDLRKEFTKDAPANVMFIDMGASAYTVSIVVFEPGKLIVKSAHCDPDLGGRDFDVVVAQFISDQFCSKFKGKVGKPMEEPKPRLKLMTAAEKAKKTLSPVGVKEARINVEMLMGDYDYSGTLTAAEYEHICQPLLAKLAGPIEACLKEAGNLSPQDLTAVEIVGGSTRIGCVKAKLTEILGGVTLSTTMNADEAVARGAALQSAILSPRFKVLPYEIVEAQPYPITISWADNDKAAGMEVESTDGTAAPTDSVVMFDRGLSFPIVRRVTLRRSGEFKVKALYDDATTQYNGFTSASGKEIAEFTIKATPGEEKKIRVNVKEDIHGIINLSSAQMLEELDDEEPAADEAVAEGEEAHEKKKKIKKTNLEFSTKRPLDYTKEEVDQLFEKEVEMTNTDRIVMETSDKRNELESYIYDMRDKISSESQLGQYGTDEEKDAFITKNEATENWLYEEGFDANKKAFADKLAELKALGSPIEKRQAEAQGRAAAVTTLQSTLQLYQNWVSEAQSSPVYAHITDEERETVRATCDAVSGWMYEMLDKQGDLQPNQDALLTVADLNAKNQELKAVCGPIMRKPVPKKEVPPPTPEPGPTAHGDAKTTDGGAPMEGVEKTEDAKSVNGDAPMEP